MRARDIIILLLASAAACRLFFAGFGLGDDGAYARLAGQILDSSYPALEERAVFASRPLLLYSLAAALAASWSEMGLVLPTMLAAAACVVAVYVIGSLLVDRLAGILAAATLLCSSLHLSYATTLCNDIIGAGLMSLGGGLVLSASRLECCRRGTAIALLGGVLTGASVAVKLSFALLILPVALVLLAVMWKAERSQKLVMAASLLGLGLSVMALAAFFWVVGGHPLAGLHVETAFNRAYMLTTPEPTVDRLLFYPRMASGLALAGPPGQQWSPTGVLFPAAVLTGAASIWRRGNATPRIVLAMLLGMFLILQFWPLQVWPEYIPIHRQTRFLYPLSVPAALMIGMMARQWLQGGRLRQAIVTALLTLHGVCGVWSAARAVSHHNDAMTDLRYAAALAAGVTGPIAADSEALDYLWFRTRFRQPPVPLDVLARGYRGVPGAVAFVGGSRRPELDAAFVAHSLTREIPSHWLKIADLPGMPGPARHVRGAAYIITKGVPPARTSSEMVGACPHDRGWVLKDVIDIGEPNSEVEHEYVIAAETWRGDRVFRTDFDVWDDGRAFTGSQQFSAGPLTVGAETCLVKRIDAGVSAQVSTWQVDGRHAGTVRLEHAHPAGWRALAVVLAGNLIQRPNVQLRETFVSSAGDVNAFRIEVYQPSDVPASVPIDKQQATRTR